MRAQRVVGAYAATPGHGRREFLDAVLALPGVTGLEISWGSPSWEADRGPTCDAVDGAAVRGGGGGLGDGGLGYGGGRGDGGLGHVVTLVGLQVGLASEHGAGLAALDASSRHHAVDAVANAHDEIVTWARPGRRVLAVELHSFPTVSPASADAAGDALRASLAEIASWDWAGAEILVEHCDARVGGTWAKGLLPLEVELAALRDVAASGPHTRVGLALNTGRSAIEGRSARTAVEHAVTSRASGLLRAVVVSGAPAQAGMYGPAWSDAHPPLVETCADSALSGADVQAVLAAAGPLLVDGVKVAATSALSPAQRLELIRATLAALPG